MIEFVIAIIFAYILLSIKALDVHATLISIIFGLMIWELRGITWFLIILIFLLVSLLATYYNHLKKHKRKMNSREVDNVLSNGLVPFMAAVFAFPYMYLGSIAAALSDTLSTEIGTLSKRKPVLITNPTEKVSPGVNGGISILGEIAAAAGSLIIATLSYFLFAESQSVFIAVFLGGFIGANIDSFLGATLENKKKMTNGSVNFVSTLFGGLITTLILFFI